MRDAGVEPTLVSYNALASAWASQGEIAATEAALGQAAARGLSLDGYSYGALLQACCRLRALPAAAAARRNQRSVDISARASYWAERMLLDLNNVERNVPLCSLCKRALGEEAFEALLARHTKRAGADKARAAVTRQQAAQEQMVARQQALAQKSVMAQRGARALPQQEKNWWPHHGGGLVPRAPPALAPSKG